MSEGGSTETENVMAELHDARIATISVLPGAATIIHFSRISVFRSTGDPLTHEVWSYRADLKLERIEKSVITGPLKDKDYVSEMIAINDQGESVDELPIGADAAVRELHLHLGSGDTLSFHNCVAQLVLREPLGKLEDWHGEIRPSDQ